MANTCISVIGMISVFVFQFSVPEIPIKKTEKSLRGSVKTYHCGSAHWLEDYIISVIEFVRTKKTRQHTGNCPAPPATASGSQDK